MRRLTFVFPGDLARPTGGYGYDRRIIAELRDMGWTVETLSLIGAYPFPTDRERAAAAEAFAAIPDRSLVVVDGLAFAVLPEIARTHARRLGLVGLVHHPLSHESGLNTAAIRTLHESEREALACARAVIVTAPKTSKLVVEEFGVDAGVVTVAEPGTDRFGHALGRGDPPVLLTLGSLIERKGHDVLIDALKRLTDLPWRARFVGEASDPEWAAMLRERAAGLGERVTFAGPTDNAHHELLGADIFVLPSRYEGYGMAFTEALACGLPVVGCPVGVLPDVLRDGSGTMVPVGDVDALERALRDLLSDPKRRAETARAAARAGSLLPVWAETAHRFGAALERVAP
ncbi:glycosyltransferase family 4 protein [Flaviflagellibacter deserti]|uniref:Glycosyltransferase family 4 protein n=1 Tax=Flaviflagellibacter deserti TaxID=2267266 RepID=A0ABV9Z0L5_9HYPH